MTTIAAMAEQTKPRRFRIRPSTLLAVAFVAVFAALFLFGDSFAGYRAIQLAGDPLEAPSHAHLLGTNKLGQDVASQLVLGARASILVAMLAGVGTVVLGGFVGVTAGWFGGSIDAVLMRVTDLVLVMPRLPLLLLVGALTGGSVTALSLLISATFWPMTARILRSQVLTLRRRVHVVAATGFGAGTRYQMRRHILPELAPLAVAAFIPAAGRAVALQAGLAFLGVGDPTTPSWGAMMRDATSYPSLFVTPAWRWWLVPPILAVVILVVGMTLLGTSAERKLLPRLERHTA